MDIVEIIDKYGFATVAAAAMGWFIYFIYTFITTEVKVKLGEANGVLIGLIAVSYTHLRAHETH